MSSRRICQSITKCEKTLKEVIDFNTANEDKAMPYFKQETLISSNEKKGLDDKYMKH
jgi:hypothetical protein